MADPSFNMPRVENLRFYCQKILPLVFDDALSYYETLCKVRYKLNEVIDALNNYSDQLKEYVDQKSQENLDTMQGLFNDYKTTVDGQLADVNNRMDGLQDEITQTINEFKTQINQQISDQQEWVNQKILEQQAQIDSTVAELYSRLNDTLTAAKAYTDFRIQEILDSLPDITTVYVHNPVTGYITTIQECVDDMYNALRYLALTAFEYDSLALTAQEYDNRELFAWWYDRYGKKLLGNRLPWKYTYSGNTGNRITYESAIFELWQNDRVNGITAVGFDTAGPTAGTFDGYQLTAYTFDWTGLPA